MDDSALLESWFIVNAFFTPRITDMAILYSRKVLKTLIVTGPTYLHIKFDLILTLYDVITVCR